MKTNDIYRQPLIGKDIAWNNIVNYALLVKHFTPLAKIVKGKIKDHAWVQPYAILEIQCFELKPTTFEMLLPVFHKEDFLHLWELYQVRGL